MAEMNLSTEQKQAHRHREQSGGGHVGRITALPEMSHRTGRMLCPHRITAWYYRVYVERKYLLSGCLSNY